MGEHVELKRLQTHRRVLGALATLVSVAAVLGCAERLHANIGVWGVFVWWAVAGIVALAWPLAFLVTAFRATSRQRTAVFSIALGLTVSGFTSLLPIGWGMVMVLNPEYAVGWHIPARGGGSDIGDVPDAISTGRSMIAFGTLFFLMVMAATVALATHASNAATLGESKSKPTSKSEAEAEADAEAVSVPDQLGWAAAVLWCCGVLSWLIALGVGVISLIQYDGVRQKLAECASGSGSCSTDMWVANELPWVLVTASAAALLPVGAAIVLPGWRSRIASTWEDLHPAANVVIGWLYQAGSVVALASAILYARWSDATCTGGRYSRSCGAAEPGFSFSGEWLHWVTVWALVPYAAMAYLVVFALLAATQAELPAPEADDRAVGGPAGTGFSGSSTRAVLTYVVSLAILLGVGWSAVSLWQRSSTTPATGGSWEEFVAGKMKTSEHPHLEEATLEIPSGRHPDIPVVAHIILRGDEPEMPSTEAASLVDTVCTYTPSRWRATTPETWVKVAYGTDRDKTRFAEFGCESDHRQTAANLMAWMEQNPADTAAREVSMKTRDDGALETMLYMSDDSTTSFSKALTYLCSFPAPRDVQRSGAITHSSADRTVSDIDCADPDAAVATWERSDQVPG